MCTFLIRVTILSNHVPLKVGNIVNIYSAKEIILSHPQTEMAKTFGGGERHVKYHNNAQW